MIMVCLPPLPPPPSPIYSLYIIFHCYTTCSRGTKHGIFFAIIGRKMGGGGLYLLDLSLFQKPTTAFFFCLGLCPPSKASWVSMLPAHHHSFFIRTFVYVSFKENLEKNIMCVDCRPLWLLFIGIDNNSLNHF